MNTSTTPHTPHTPLETLLLFRGIAQYGLEEHTFVPISEALQRNALVKRAPTYDARRLSPDVLRELFLRLVREELRAASEDTPGPDGALSPASKKRRLQSPALLTLKDARQHVEKIEAARVKLHDAYLREAVDEIRQLESRFDSLLGEINELEKLGVRDSEIESKPQSPHAAQVAGKHEAGPANGVGPSLGASPRPPQIPPPHPVPQHPLRTLQPLLPQPAQQQDVRNGPSPSQPAASEKPSPAPRSPAPAYPEVGRSPQLGQQEPPRAPVARPAATPKPSNGTPQVLQAPQGVAPFQPHPPQPPAAPAAAEGLQRPESVGGPRHSPALPPANAQVPAQGQLKWEPPYQPHAPPRQTANASLQHPPAGAPPPPPHPVPSPRSAQQQGSHPGPTAVQGQVTRPVSQQQVLVPPQPTSQLGPPLQSPPVKSPAGLAGGPGSNRQQPLPPTTAASGAPSPQAPYHPQYNGQPHPTPGQATPVQAQAAQAHPAPIRPGAGRTPGMPSTSASPVTVPPRPSPGLAAPQQRPQPPNMQAQTSNQQPAPQSVPSPAPTHPDGTQRYSSPYPLPRPAAVDRIHPRFPAAATPTPAARFSPAPPAPQTPVMTLPPRLAGGSGTKWVSNSTPSTPKPGIEFRLGYDDVPSPAFEPTSPILRPSAPPAPKELQRRAGPTGSPKQKQGRAQVSQRSQAGVSALHSHPAPTTSVGSETKQTSQEAAEPESAKIKDEVTTPRPTTETGDTTADESFTGRPQPLRSTKRKREDLTPTPVQTPVANQMRDALREGLGPSTADGPKFVLWTRSFNKVCGSAMEQIVHHRSANMFAAPIREKDAPGYHKVVRQAQDLKTIRAAINHGNRAAAQAAAALPDGDPGTSCVWLPRTEDLVPPRSIINSSQLDRELAHMFSNAVMYNPDPHHGPGPAFLRDVEGDGEMGDGDGDGGGGGGGGGGGQDSGVLGYKVDEFGVVNDARGMFVEVEKLLSELRSAEVRRNVPPGGPGGGGYGTGTSTRQASVLGHGNGGGGGSGESGRDDSAAAAAAAAHQQGGGGDDEEATGGEGHEDGAVKRRRIARG